MLITGRVDTNSEKVEFQAENVDCDAVGVVLAAAITATPRLMAWAVGEDPEPEPEEDEDEDE